jgi:hypothetical protein
MIVEIENTDEVIDTNACELLNEATLTNESDSLQTKHYLYRDPHNRIIEYNFVRRANGDSHTDSQHRAWIVKKRKDASEIIRATVDLTEYFPEKTA